MTHSKFGQVRFENTGKNYGDFTAIPNLNLTIEPGQLVTLLGPSGCGKTTTLRMIAGLETPTSGRIMIGGDDVTRLPPNERDVSMVFQSYALFPHMSVLENVKYGLESSGFKDAEDLALKGLDLVGLREKAPRLPSELSGGQQQRVAVARALVLEPQVLLLDEPLSNLDARLRRLVRTEIREIQQRLDFTAVYVTHDQEEALAVSDRIVVMRDGLIEQDGTPYELYESPASEFIADFIGEANILDCDISGVNAETANVQIGGKGFDLRSRNHSIGKGKLAARANSIKLSRDVNGGPAGKIKSAAYLGDHFQYEVMSDLGLLFVIDNHTDELLENGTSVGIDFDARGLALIGGKK
ncbi:MULTISPECIES: ABC transporter ATP-binding protein [unclassified Pseudovibrio]|uniref:ABC transporter ATP-binding protein n=1 Tax=unclassified Pseudovibrio TaxID=2627060 RepID=UPI0007AE4587|nr:MULTISPECIES: ABC transporter ATP-binding protein [unclassified Pseudovibrio]KZL13407.1 Spermidine/putrescine import ATP-binding protein PotA [Pseudovibrio sp. Ad26]KZL18305.1 Spermidine/putrescine import ATP-binding protein PotA [Pseudovibrio sp. WM33]